MIRNLLASIAAIAIAASAQAAVIGAPPNQSGGSDLDSYLEADTFSVASTFNPVQIKFWTLQIDATDYVSPTYWGVYTNVASAPGAALFSGTPTLTGVSTGVSAFGFNEFVYTIPVSFTLGVGNYWLVLHNGAINTMPATNFFWEWSADSGNSRYLDLALGLASPWNRNDSSLAFQLSETPEPASLWLSAGGLMAALLARRRLGRNK